MGMTSLEQIGINAKLAVKSLSKLRPDEKNEILKSAAAALIEKTDFILAENGKDVSEAIENGVKGAFIDRLTLTEARIKSMADGLLELTLLPDPTGVCDMMKTLPNGLIIAQKRVSLGVIGIIFEARPNVSADSFGLCFKAGNAVILRGGKEAIRSNCAIIDCFRQTLAANGFDENFVQIITDTSRETAVELMKMREYIDVLIPRGGAGLISSVVQNSTIPVIQTGVGNCHIFVDETADFGMATSIIINAKTQRPGVCNACEKLLIHEKIADTYLPLICDALTEKGVEIRGDEKSKKIVPSIIMATDDDWATEYEDMIICIGIVSNIDAAIEHIETYSTNHSEAIVTQSYQNSQKFLNEVNSAAVYVNASTRFTDGNEFGMGAEIGISTQKLHARGPMGLKELTTTKYIIFGDGHIRA